MMKPNIHYHNLAAPDPKPIEGPLLISSAVFCPKAFIICLYEYSDDFWFNLGKHIGWGRFSCLEQDRPKADANGNIKESTGEVRYELVEIRPPYEKAPSPLVSWSNVLWRRQEAVAAEKRSNASRQKSSDYLLRLQGDSQATSGECAE